MPLPTFILAGAPKSGTSALWGYLDEHPDICMAREKEPRFFSHITGKLEQGKIDFGPARSGRYAKGIEWYKNLFYNCKSSTIIGEASTYYFYAHDSVALIKKHIPDVKLIFLLRDPVKRLYSHYWQETKIGFKFPEFSEMVKTDHPRFLFYCHVSAYRKHLARFYRSFPSENILVLTMESLWNDPDRSLAKIYRFLGTAHAFRPKSIGQRYNLPRQLKWPIIERYMELSRYSIANQLPSTFRKSLGLLRRFITKINSRPFEYPGMAPSIRARLLPRFESDIRFVEQILGIRLSVWRALEHDDNSADLP